VLAQIWCPNSLGEQFLVLDEPTAAFDLAHQQMTLDIVKQFSQRGVGVLMVVHDLNLAARCADNLVVVNGGVIEAFGRPDKILTEQLVEKVFDVKATISRHPTANTPLVIT
jgi:iron complex transport system ATP-binding protein